MKKIILQFIFIFLLSCSFLFLQNSFVLASCHADRPGFVSNCDPDDYSCEDNFDNISATVGLDSATCADIANSYSPPACYEFYEIEVLNVIEAYCELYHREGASPQPSVAPGSPGEDCRESAPLCDDGLEPFVGVGGKCKCIKVSEPQSSPAVFFKPEDCEVDGEEGIQTALGCFPTQPQAIVNWILKYSIMAAGGIGFLIMLWASFQIMTSQGDPEKLKNGQQLLVSAIVGILIIVFALFLLRFIGWDILRIPGWET